MNLLFLSQVFPDDGHATRGPFNLALCRSLAAYAQVRVVSPRAWTEVLPRRVRWGGPLHADKLLAGTRITADYPTFWYLPRIALHRSGAALTRSLRRPLRRLLDGFRPDAVLSYWAHPEGRAALDLARQLGIPSACIVGGSDVLLLPKLGMARRDAIASVLAESDAVITISEGLREAAIALGAPVNQVHTIYQGIDPQLYHPRDQAEARRRVRVPQGVPAYLWVGRMVDVKRVELALHAAARLRTQGFRFKLYLVGDGPRDSSLRTLAAELELGTSVDFVGPTPPDQLPDWYCAADATILCSKSEGIPNVLRESLACGTPFVSTDVGSISEIADPDCSALVSDDPQALAAGMQAILAPSYRLAAAAQPARTWTDTAEDVLLLLKWLRLPTELRGPRPVLTSDDLVRRMMGRAAPSVPKGSAGSSSAEAHERVAMAAAAPTLLRRPAEDDFMDALNRLVHSPPTPDDAPHREQDGL